MAMKKFDPPITTIDEYIAVFPRDIQATLKKIRSTVRKAAPDAEEKISYQIPTFKGFQNLVHFAAFTNHIGFFPSSSGVAAFRKELTKYKTSKGTIQFSFDEPVPYGLIEKIVRFRVKEDEERRKAKMKTGKMK